MDRRPVLQGLHGGAAVNLAGCCASPQRARPLMETAMVPASFAGTSACLAPRTFNTIDVPDRGIDVHAHFFNASDVTVRGYIEGPVANASGPLAPLVRAVGPLAEFLGNFAVDAKQER